MLHHTPESAGPEARLPARSAGSVAGPMPDGASMID